MTKSVGILDRVVRSEVVGHKVDLILSFVVAKMYTDFEQTTKIESLFRSCIINQLNLL